MDYEYKLGDFIFPKESEKSPYDYSGEIVYLPQSKISIINELMMAGETREYRVPSHHYVIKNKEGRHWICEYSYIKLNYIIKKRKITCKYRGKNV